MLIYFLAATTFVIWVALYGLYFREELKAWFANRFEKDKPLPSDEASTEPAKPFDYIFHSKNE